MLPIFPQISPKDEASFELPMSSHSTTPIRFLEVFGLLLPFITVFFGWGIVVLYFWMAAIFFGDPPFNTTWQTASEFILGAVFVSFVGAVWIWLRLLRFVRGRTTLFLMVLGFITYVYVLMIWNTIAYIFSGGPI